MIMKYFIFINVNSSVPVYIYRYCFCCFPATTEGCRNAKFFSEARARAKPDEAVELISLENLQPSRQSTFYKTIHTMTASKFN